jgi:hypothetical protein
MEDSLKKLIIQEIKFLTLIFNRIVKAARILSPIILITPVKIFIGQTTLISFLKKP